MALAISPFLSNRSHVFRPVCTAFFSNNMAVRDLADNVQGLWVYTSKMKYITSKKTV